MINFGCNSAAPVCIHILSFGTILIVTDNCLQFSDNFHMFGAALKMHIYSSRLLFLLAHSSSRKMLVFKLPALVEGRHHG